jgi:hypothetical protein
MKQLDELKSPYIVENIQRKRIISDKNLSKNLSNNGNRVQAWEAGYS